MREIILDTETTGLDPQTGHRIIEIGAVELINRRFTHQHFHYYINPERDIDAGALAVHGITQEFLLDKPLFSHIAEEFMAFVKGATLVIHNAPFDVGFLNHELSRHAGRPENLTDHCEIFDTLAFARKKHPGQKNNLDALCKRYQIDNSERSLHGALLDAKILGLVYLAMTGGQSSFFDGEFDETPRAATAPTPAHLATQQPLGRAHVLRATVEELSMHEEFMKKLIE